MRLRISILLLLVTGASGTQTHGKFQSPGKFDTFMRPYVTSNNFSGDVLIEHHGTIVFRRSYGYADREHKRANGETTQFHIASMSMQYTSAAILRIIGQHKLTLETTVGNLLPHTPGAEKITVGDLLLQQSGLNDINSHSDYGEVLQHHQTPTSLVAQIDGHSLGFPPGTKHAGEEHSAFNVLALLLEKTTGREFSKALEEVLFRPLRLHATYADDDGTAPPSAAQGYQPKELAGLEPAPAIHWSAKAGNASIVTTTSDELRLVHALFSDNFIDSRMHTRLLETTPRVGYGWFRSESKEFNAPTYYMNGRSPGFASYVLHIPREALTVIVFSNIYCSAASDIGDGLARMALGLPHKSFHPLVKAPKAIKRPLLFRFPDDFYQPKAEMTLFRRNGDTFLRWPNGTLSPLIPIAADEWLDRAYWEPVRLDRDQRGLPEALQYDRFRGELLRSTDNE
jgi:CubicO group peptidase (beta-lactamase class C family)